MLIVIHCLLCTSRNIKHEDFMLSNLIKAVQNGGKLTKKHNNKYSKVKDVNLNLQRMRCSQ